MRPMRTTLVTIIVGTAVVVAVACGGKNTAPATTDPPIGTTPDPAVNEPGPTPTEPEQPITTGESGGSGTAMALDDGQGSGAGDGSGSAEPAAPPPPVDAFQALPREEQLKIMKTKVLPAMTKAFKAFDKKEFAKFGCKTCHGAKSVADGTYQMPNPDLPPLDFAAIEAGTQHPKTAAFMKEKVNPQMAELLGKTQYTPDNPTGFGCLHCHTMKQ
jgi:hypothetical protein